MMPLINELFEGRINPFYMSVQSSSIFLGPNRTVKDLSADYLGIGDTLRLPIKNTLPNVDIPGSMIFDAVAEVPKFWDPITSAYKSVAGGSGPSLPSSLASVGAGSSLVVNGVSPNFQIRNLAAGANVVLALDGDGSVIITSTAPPTATLNLTSVGAGSSLIQSASPPLTLKSLLGADGVSVTPSPTALTISYSGPPLTNAELVDVSSVPSTSLIVNGVGPAFVIRKITTSGGLVMSADANTIDFEIPTPPYSLITFSNSPGAVGVSFIPDAGDAWPTLQMKSISAASNRVVITSDSTSVTIGSTINWASSSTIVPAASTLPLLSANSNTNDFVLVSPNFSERIGVVETPTNVAISIPVPQVFRTTFAGDIRLQVKYHLNSIPTLVTPVMQNVSYVPGFLNLVMNGDIDVFSINFEVSGDCTMRIGCPDKYNNTVPSDVQPMPCVQFWSLNPATHAPNLNAFPANPDQNSAPRFAIASIQPTYMDFLIDQVAGSWKVCIRY